MSLINDALKRASQSERSRPRDNGSHAVMQPAPESRRSFVPELVGVSIIILLIAAGALFWHTLTRHVIAPPPVAAANAAAPAVVTPPPKAEPAPAPAPAPPPAVVTPPPAASAPPAAVAVAPPPPPPAPPPFPELKLQGIFYNRNNPKAAINGQIRAQNEQIGDVRILAITQDKVTVQWNGQTKDLILPGN
ncbi:MAG: hypothetical protein ABSG04_08050 [Verrucomicrobiota bacterium]|jgi:hypothetical protein